MTAEIVLVLLLLAATLLAAGLAAVILAALGPAGWIVVLALIVTGALVWRIVVGRATWSGEDLQDDWRAG